AVCHLLRDPLAPVRIGLFLTIALLLGGLAATILALGGGAGWEEALLLGLPLGLVEGAIVLAARYPCQSAPLRASGMTRALVTQATAALASAGAWVVLGGILARMLETLPRYGGAALRLRGSAPMLVVVGALVFLLAAAAHYLILALEAARAAEVRGMEARVLAREAELRALRAQVDPHFLFNSLNSIATLTSEDAGAARRMCLLLAGFLRRSLALGGRDRVTLGEEIALVDEYLAIEKVRFGSRLEVAREVDAGCEAALIPPLLLQPLVENAVRHGVAQRIEGGTLRLRAERRGAGEIAVTIDNPRNPERSGRRGAGLGLENVRGRLRSLYGDRARLEVATPPEAFVVTVTLPYVAATETSLAG
ncbi:MAG TPA: histidine kinase, partial [Candidatus Polarisedimenticolia bacterium]|nr:histidine kinase [Candidatus Polarisedimenticolia bacterium]